MSKDLTMLVAHPDDDVLFGWPMLDRVKKIVCASSDRYNAQRAWCKERGDCLREVGEILGADVVIHDNDSEFYRAETRNGTLKRIAEEILSSLAGTNILFSHNAHGCYGHLDHILCHHIARCYQAQSGCDLLVSDIAIESNWLPLPIRGKTLYGQPGEFVSGPHTLDRARFDSLKAIYDKRGCWTWNQEPVTECGVYRI